MDAEKQFHLDSFNDLVDASSLRQEWEEWHRAFELVLELKNVETQHQKLLFMLARGGRGLQRIYYNLAPVAGEIHPGPVKVPLAPQEIPEYDNAVKRLTAFFVGKRNERVELEIYRSLKQKAGESFNCYILRLRTQAARCDFRDREEKELLHQITVGAFDERIRDKGLESIMSLDELMNYAINREVLLKQKEKSQPFRSEAGIVASVKQDWGRQSGSRSGNYGQAVKRERKWENHGQAGNQCNRCGSWDHDRDSKYCRARKANCHNCGRYGHFSRNCTAGTNSSSKTRYTWKKSDVANTLRGEDSQEAGSGRRAFWNSENETTPKVE